MVEYINFLFGDLPYVLAVLSVILIPATAIFVMTAWKRKQYGKSVLAGFLSGGLTMLAVSYIGTLMGVSLTFGGYVFGAPAIVGLFAAAGIVTNLSFKLVNHLSSVLAEYADEIKEKREVKAALEAKRDNYYNDIDNIERQIRSAEQNISAKSLVKRAFKL